MVSINASRRSLLQFWRAFLYCLLIGKKDIEEGFKNAIDLQSVTKTTIFCLLRWWGIADKNLLYLCKM